MEKAILKKEECRVHKARPIPWNHQVGFENMLNVGKKESVKSIIVNQDSVIEASMLEKISSCDEELYKKYSNIIAVDKTLSRQLVSFQANKKKGYYRWYKYKEGFSADLVEKCIRERIYSSKKLLDPFAGSGTALFAASEMGIDSVGIELVPIGQELIEARNVLLNEFEAVDFNVIENWIKRKPWQKSKGSQDFNELKITAKAYPPETETQIKKYLYCLRQENSKVQKVLMFALLCILESISYTRKDGQYLRWDQRSGRRYGAIPFDKGKISEFDKEIVLKLNEIISDSKGETFLDLFSSIKKPIKPGSIEILKGSCLDILPTLKGSAFDLVITSPPYCNRYDYTRTYALELAMLLVDETELSKLRQAMLSCTVENRSKDLAAINPKWETAIKFANSNKLLQAIIEYLEYKKANKTINNNGIPRMVKGYFYEMACVIFELYRTLNKSGQVIMVNDNVKYAGASVSVDLILSKIAEDIGFKIDNIAVLPNGKGNSSQQMGIHGREALRKCIYVWSKQ
ncbi:MAG: DNA methyltransferase [Smithella sp.]